MLSSNLRFKFIKSNLNFNCWPDEQSSLFIKTNSFGQCHRRWKYTIFLISEYAID